MRNATIEKIAMYVRDIKERESFIDIILDFLEESRDEKLLNYLKEERTRLLESQMMYIGMTRAWLDTIPEADVKICFCSTAKAIKTTLKEAQVSLGEQALKVFARGYYYCMQSMFEENGLEFEELLEEDVLNSVRVMINKEDDTSVVANIFKLYDYHENTAYYALVKRKTLHEEMHKLSLNGIREGF